MLRRVANSRRLNGAQLFLVLINTLKCFAVVEAAADADYT